MNYHCLNPIAQIGLDLFDDTYTKTDDYMAAEGVLVRSAAMHELEISDKLLCVARAGAGVNNIPLDKMADEGVVVFNTPGANANGVKELVLAGMLLASRDIIGGVEWVKANASEEGIAKLAEKEKKKFAGTEILGKKLGVIGLGAIGVKVANAALDLGMEVYGYDPFLSTTAAWNINSAVKLVKSPEDIYSCCDFITVHVPALDSTKGMINKAAMDMMKNGVVILNFARDILVNETDILAAIKEGKVRKYVCDFPNPTTAGQDGVIIIPHLGASTEEAEDNCAVMAVKEMKEFLENGNVINSVNFPAVDMGVCKSAGRVAICYKQSDDIVKVINDVFAKNGINVVEMTNKNRGNYGYALADLSVAVTDALIADLNALSDVTKARKVK